MLLYIYFTAANNDKYSHKACFCDFIDCKYDVANYNFLHSGYGAAHAADMPKTRLVTHS